MVLDFLNGAWRRHECDIATMPHYCKFDDASEGDQPLLHLYFAPHVPGWRIAPHVNAQQVLAEAFSDAAHPNTITKSSWRLLFPVHPGRQPMLQSCSAFDTSFDGPNTPEQPFLIEEIGRDFFTRAQPRKQVIWFECPSTGEVYHSGAKKAGQQSDKPGNRYCPICNRCFSANNFKSQHMKSHARFLSTVKTTPQPDYTANAPNLAPAAAPPALAPPQTLPNCSAPSVPPEFTRVSALPPEYTSLPPPSPAVATTEMRHSPNLDALSLLRVPASCPFDLASMPPLLSSMPSPMDVSSLLSDDEPMMLPPMLYEQLPAALDEIARLLPAPVHRNMSFDPIEEMMVAF